VDLTHLGHVMVRSLAPSVRDHEFDHCRVKPKPNWYLLLLRKVGSIKEEEQRLVIVCQSGETCLHVGYCFSQ
jgi:hypothetical protein